MQTPKPHAGLGGGGGTLGRMADNATASPVSSTTRITSTLSASFPSSREHLSKKATF